MIVNSFRDQIENASKLEGSNYSHHKKDSSKMVRSYTKEINRYNNEEKRYFRGHRHFMRENDLRKLRK